MILNVDGIRVLECDIPTPIPRGQLGLFAWGPGRVNFSETAVSEKAGRAFVVMEFSPSNDVLYKQVISHVCEEPPFRLEARHAGEEFGRVILQDIVRAVVEAAVVIVEITPSSTVGYNPNVFYELGYAHALRKPTILLADKGKIEKLPFDISGYRCLFYENSIGGKSEVKEQLRKHLAAILHEST